MKKYGILVLLAISLAVTTFAGTTTVTAGGKGRHKKAPKPAVTAFMGKHKSKKGPAIV
jgi:hypothetical protein